MPAVLLAALVVMAPPAAHGLASDREQPMSIEADQGELDDQQGVATYTGAVVVTQGTLKINGDTLYVFFDENDQITKAVALGAPAYFEQLPDGGKDYVKARALRMEYIVGEEVIQLYDQAHVHQGRDSVAGNRIDYDTRQGKVKARKAETGEERVKVIITPGKSGQSAPP